MRYDHRYTATLLTFHSDRYVLHAILSSSLAGMDGQ